MVLSVVLVIERLLKGMSAEVHEPLPSRKSLQPYSYVFILWCGDVLVELKHGKTHLSKGYYAYVGSANIKRPYLRVIRHFMKSGKKLKWHVDYLTKVCSPVSAILCGGVSEDALYEILTSLDRVTPSIRGFGCSDYRSTHETHLFKFDKSVKSLNKIVGYLISILKVRCNEIEIVLD